MPRRDVGSAVGYGWKKFTENVGPFILLMLAVFVVSLVLSLIRQVVTPDSGGYGAVIIGLVLSAIVYIITSIVQAGVWRAGLGVTKGTTPSVAQLTETDNIVPYILTSILVGIGLIIGLVLCIIPGIIWLLFTAYAPIIALDKGVGAVDAIKTSITMVKDNFGQVFVILLVAGIIWVVGYVLCCVGLLVTAPVALVTIVYSYRALNNETGVS
ncbi:hypothetical protein BH10ACT3_BH10ACT3_05160 [soil metagenome]